MSALKEQCGEKTGKLGCCAVGKDTQQDFPILEWQTYGRQLLSQVVITLWSLSRDRRINQSCEPAEDVEPDPTRIFKPEPDPSLNPNLAASMSPI